MQTDEIMKKTLMSLLRDFAPTLGQAVTARRSSLLREGRIAELRAIEYPIWDSSSIYFNKCMQQIGGFLKRYRFANDVYTDDELLQMAKDKFMATQERISSPFIVNAAVYKWLQEARRICKAILGPYDLEEHYTCCRFGKRACKGHPLSRSYLDSKLKGPYTGSDEHIKWFKSYLHSDPILQELLCSNSSSKSYLDIEFEMCESLELSFVPKSWKAMRVIKPNTLLGSFYTYGLGKLIQKRLRLSGLDINSLQAKHKDIMLNWDRARKLVTADLTSASDSISRTLLQRVLPRPWYNAVMCGFIPNATHKGDIIPLSSVCAMGDGHTFPLQTLIFYALCKSIGNLLNKRSYVSVYGDDLIYSRYIHKYVVDLFPRVHLLLNKEKTYASSNFRESCGMDTFHGTEIRPCSIEGENQDLHRAQLCEFLYKLHNSLTRRWEQCEITSTITYLEDLIFMNSDKGIFQVPPSFPDYSGVKVHRIVQDRGYSPVLYNRATQALVFNLLGHVPKHRVVRWQFPYYWDTLRARKEREELSIYDRSVDVLQWKKITFARRNGKRICRRCATVAQRSSDVTRGQTGSTLSWI